ncbi:unnamed protein product [Linum trigynum]|uniref:LOB domain-containing protein n=1 Tax=Linum trigynum TaxID=586398 RepID=A0AAV2DVS8_9ROSI
MADHHRNQRCEPCKYSKRIACPAYCRFRPYFTPSSMEFRRVVDVYVDTTSKVLRNQIRSLPNIQPIEDTTYFPNNPSIHDRAYFHSLMVELNVCLGNMVSDSSGNDQAEQLENQYLQQE